MHSANIALWLTSTAIRYLSLLNYPNESGVYVAKLVIL